MFVIFNFAHQTCMLLTHCPTAHELGLLGTETADSCRDWSLCCLPFAASCGSCIRFCSISSQWGNFQASNRNWANMVAVSWSEAMFSQSSCLSSHSQWLWKACNILFSPLDNLPTGLYILPFVISFFKSTENISASAGPIFTIFHQMEGICINFIDPDLFLRFLKKRFLGNNFFDKFGELTFIQHAGIPKRIRLSQFWFKSIQWQYVFYKLCKFDQDRASNSRDYEGKNYTFLDGWQKSAFYTKYLSKYGTDRHHSFSAGRQMYYEYKTGISFVVAQGMSLYGNQLISEFFCRRRNWLLSLFALAFWKGIQYRLVNEYAL